MKDAAAVAERLTLLSTMDRAWLLEHLPADAKSKLLEYLGAPEIPHTAANGDDTPPALDGMDTARLLLALRDEPAWLVAAVVNDDSIEWRRRCFDALPAALRAEVERLRIAGFVARPGLVQFLDRELLARCEQDTAVNGTDSAAPSNFESLVRRFSRSWRRRGGRAA